MPSISNRSYTSPSLSPKMSPSRLSIRSNKQVDFAFGLTQIRDSVFYKHKTTQSCKSAALNVRQFSKLSKSLSVREEL